MKLSSQLATQNIGQVVICGLALVSMVLLGSVLGSQNSSIDELQVNDLVSLGLLIWLRMFGQNFSPNNVI
ncbi:MAG: hypothetical protein AAF623_06075 [Planctomycetota bacterium]